MKWLDKLRNRSSQWELSDVVKTFEPHHWESLRTGERFDALQKYADWLAKECGLANRYPIQRAKHIAPSSSANYTQHSRVININYDVLCRMKYCGKKDTLGWLRTLDAIAHEIRHAWQDETAHGLHETSVSKDQKVLFGMTFPVKERTFWIDNGSQINGASYLNGVICNKFGWELYRLQASERDAFQFAKRVTTRIHNEIERIAPLSPNSVADFSYYCREYGAEPVIKRLERAFPGVDIVQSLDNAMLNLFNNENRSVDSAFFVRVFASSVATYNRANGVLQPLPTELPKQFAQQAQTVLPTKDVRISADDAIKQAQQKACANEQPPKTQKHAMMPGE